MNDGLKIIENCCLMAIDFNHAWWLIPPFECAIKHDIKYSYTVYDKFRNSYSINLKRKYDLIHELLHIGFGIIDDSAFSNEVLANISESMELLSLELWPQDKYNEYCL